MTKEEKEFNVEDLLRQNKRLKLILKTIILLLVFIIIILFYYKKNLINFKFVLKGDQTVTLNYGEKYKEEGFKAKIYNKDAKSNVTIKSNIKENKLGEYEVKYRLLNKYLNVDKTIIRKVKIVDVIPPELKVESEDNIYTFVGDDFVSPSYQATDNYDKDLTEKVKVDSNVDINNVGNYVIKYQVKDSSGNESVKEINVHIEEKRKRSKVIVYISRQQLDYYENDVVVFSSPVVTGINGGTPKGSYTLLNKSRNVALVGADYVSHVKYWMPFIGRSYGLHDAPWRSNFGGDIYKTNGSHGCVNLPTDSAAKLYDLLEVGTPIIIAD